MSAEETVENLSIYVNRGITPKYTEDSKDSILILNQKCIRDFKVSLGPARLNDLKKRIVTVGKTLEKYDVLINSTGVGTLGRVAQYYGKTGSATVDSHITIVRPNQQLIDPIYFGYLLKAKQSLIESFAEGTTGQTELARDAVKELKLSFVKNKDQQKQIGDALLNLDRKIELNRQTNQTLEEMAQAVFKSWFVDFDPTRAKVKAKENGEDPTRAAKAALAGKTVDQLDTLPPEHLKTLTTTAALFPDTLVNSELGEIPKGWEAKPLYETAEYVNGGAFKAIDFCDPKEGLPIIKIAELKQGVYGGTKYTLKNVRQRHYITNDDVLYSWSGSPETSLEVFKWFGGDGWLNQHIFKLNFSSDEQKYFTYYLLKHMKPILIGIAQDKQTTGLGHVTVADMKRLLLPYPDDALHQKFKQIIAPLYEQCSTIEKENMTLSETRDALLPKLLSGEIEVNGEVTQ